MKARIWTFKGHYEPYLDWKIGVPLMAQLQDGRIMEKEIFPHITVITAFSGDVEQYRKSSGPFKSVSQIFFYFSAFFSFL